MNFGLGKKGSKSRRVGEVARNAVDVVPAIVIRVCSVSGRIREWVEEERVLWV